MSTTTASPASTAASPGSIRDSINFGSTDTVGLTGNSMVISGVVVNGVVVSGLGGSGVSDRNSILSGSGVISINGENTNAGGGEIDLTNFRLSASPTIGISHNVRVRGVPKICELLLCLAVEPHFQKDRLGDYQERFHDFWLPKFGRRGAVAMYVWHVLRQSRLIDWLIRVSGWGDPL